MTETSVRPDCSTLEIPTDAWTQPFWDAAARRTLLMPRCGKCGRFRWPPGPFCPACQSQKVEWVSPGQGRVYSFSLVPDPTSKDRQPPGILVPALIEFDGAKGIRLISSIVDTPLERIKVGTDVELDWIPAANATVPVFRIL